MKKVIGLDLGSSMSAVATIENGNSTIIVNKEGNRTTPSVVQISDDGEIKVGSAAKRSMVTKPQNTIQLVKRLMGATYDDNNVQEMIKRSTYNIINKNNKPYIKIGEKEYSPEQISSIIVNEMKKTAEDYLGTKVTDVVITCPAWFNDVQRQATKTAGELAGLNVLRIINEPTAAILASSLTTDGKEKKVAVVDAGGATLDVSVCDISDGVVEVLASDGDVFLGGSDYDQALTDYIISEFKKEHNVDLSKDKLAYPRIIEAAEKAKCELSSMMQTDINLPYISITENGPLNLIMTITRAKFESLIKKLNDRTVEKALSAIKKAGIDKSELNCILLVGGTTRIPSLQEALKANVCQTLSQNVNPDEAVALGAAKQADILAGNSEGDVLLLDVTPLSLGIETMGGVMTRLVDANTTIPTTKKKIFSTAEDNQPAVTIHVLQGERPMASDNKSIGMFTLDGILPAKRGVPQIEVSFDIDANGIVSVTAKDLGTNKEQKITIQNQNLSEQEIEQIKKDAEKFKEEDEKKQKDMQTLNSADQYAFSIENMLSDENMSSKIEESKRSELESNVKELHEAVNNKDVSKTEELQKKLSEIWNPIVTELYKAQQEANSEQSTTTNK